MEPTTSGEYIVAATKVSPPVAVTGITLAGIGLQDWVMIVTLIYTVLQIGFLLYGKIKAKKNGR